MTQNAQNGRPRRFAGFAAALFAASLLAACAGTEKHAAFYQPAPGSFFTVTLHEGDTLSVLAARYQVEEDDLMAINHIYHRDTVYAGAQLRIPAYGHLREARAEPSHIPVHDHYASADPEPKPRARVQDRFEARAPSYDTSFSRGSVSVAALPSPGGEWRENDERADYHDDSPDVAVRDGYDGDGSNGAGWDDFPLPPLASDIPEPQPRPGAFRPEARAEAAKPAPEESGWTWNWFAPSHDADKAGEEKADGGKNFVWPLKGPLLSAFGADDHGARNDGINISAARGAPVHAAAAGTVTYVGDELKGYGNLILVRHDNGYVTAYAHADSVAVERGQRVTRGQIIAYAGETGDVTRPQLHFEIRLGTKPVDPRAYLPRVLSVASN